ncbi:MAG: MFS transporter [Actinomycetota bacterium]
MPSSADSHLDLRRSWVMAIATFASTFAVFGVAYSFGAFFDPMVEEFDAGSSETALFFALTTFLYFTLGLVAGRWSDHVGPRPVLLTGAVAMLAGLWVTSMANSLWLGIAAYSLGVGIAVACGYVPMVAVVSGWFERQRTLALGVAVAGIGFGTLVVTPLANWLIVTNGWRVAYRVLAIGAAVILVVCALVAARPPQPATTVVPIPLREVVGTPAFRSLYGSVLLMSISLFVPFVFLVDYAEQFDIESGRAALLVGLIGGSSIVGRLVLGTLAPRVGLVRLYQGCFAFMGASFLVWLVANGRYTLLVLFAVVLGVAYGGFIALSAAVAADAFGTDGLGGVLGALYTASAIGGLLGPPLAGAVLDRTDGYTVVILGSLVITLAALAVLLTLPRHTTSA